MSLSKARKSVALICKVLDLPYFHSKKARSWNLHIGDCSIALSYLSESQELEISHQLPYIEKKLDETRVEICACFSKNYLSRQTHWIKWDIAKQSMCLYSRIDFCGDNECELAIFLPCFLQHCCSWKSFVQRPFSQFNRSISRLKSPIAICAAPVRGCSVALSEKLES